MSMNGAESKPNYDEVFDQVVNWSHDLRVQKQRLRLQDKALDRAIYDNYLATLLGIFPNLSLALQGMIQNQELVGADNPAVRFASSPFALEHLTLQKLRLTLMSETLERAEFFKDLPDDIKTKIPDARSRLAANPEPQLPHLDNGTIVNLSKIPSYDRLMWEKAQTALLQGQVLLCRTLATKYRFGHAPIQGYNRKAVQVAEQMLVMLDTLSSCTPWQLHFDPRSYISRVSQVCNIKSFVTPQFDIERSTEPGRMWSNERSEDNLVQIWEEALSTGVHPGKLSVI